MEGRATRGAQDARHQRGTRVARALAALSFVVYGLVVWWPTRELPYYWDARDAIDGTLGLAESGFIPPVPFHTYFAHPPLFHLLLGLAWKAFGHGRLVSHVVVLPWLPLAMGGTYAMGTRLDGRLLGLAAAFAFGAVPLALVEVGQIYFDLPMVALATCGAAAWLHEKRWAACGLLCLAVLTKLPAAVVPLSLLVIVASSRALWREPAAYLSLVVPLVLGLAWGAYHDAVAGFWFVSVTAPRGPRSIDVAARLFPYFFVKQLRAVPLAAGALAAAWVLGVRRERAGAATATCTWLAVAPFVFHVVIVVFLPRYALVALPPFLAVALGMVKRALPSAAAFGAFAGLVVVLFATRWHPRRAPASDYELQPPEDLTYLDHIEVLRQAASFVETRYPDAEILGGFQETLSLAEPQQGYVARAHDVTHCQYFARHEGRTQLVFLHRYGLEQRICEDVVRSHPSGAVARFEANGKWIEIRELRD